jgi:hypothetical protein
MTVEDFVLVTIFVAWMLNTVALVLAGRTRRLLGETIERLKEDNVRLHDRLREAVSAVDEAHARELRRRKLPMGPN